MSDELVKRLRDAANDEDAHGLEYDAHAAIMRKAADALERQWIPVGERLPEDGTKVDIWVNIYASPRSMGWSDADREINCWLQDGKWFHYYNGKTAEIYADYVTHWMPLPPPPAKRD